MTGPPEDLIAGYSIVRLPECNYAPDANKNAPQPGKSVAGVHYGGVMRSPWLDIEYPRDGQRPPAGLDEAIAGIAKLNADDFTGIVIARDLGPIRELLKWANRDGEKNEIIVLSSPRLNEIKGAIKSTSEIAWIGYDIVNLGFWSLLDEGFFARPGLFLEFVFLLNRDGLFGDTSVCERYLGRHRAAVAKGLLEPLVEKPYGIDFIRVGRPVPAD